MSNKPIYDLYTQDDPEVGKRTVHRGYVLINGLWASNIQFCATAEMRDDGVYLETSNSIYKFNKVTILPDWAYGTSRYLPKPNDIVITPGNVFRNFSGVLGEKTITGQITAESDDWWEVKNNRDIVRYLK